MRITKLGHACVRIEDGDHVVVIDPGVFTEPGAVEGATAVLITHEHPDHWSPDHLEGSAAPVVTIAAVAEKLPETVRDRTTVVRPGDSVDVGLPVEVVGEKHAVIYDALPHFDNSGFLLRVGGTTLFHPGDALTVPDAPIDLLLLPVSAPWLKVSECIDYALEVGAARNLGIHDAVYSAAGLGIVGGHLERFLGERGLGYTLLEPGAEL